MDKKNGLNTGDIRQTARNIIGIVFKTRYTEETIKEIGKILWEIYNKGIEQGDH